MTRSVMQPRDVHTRRKALTIGLALGCGSKLAQAQSSPPPRNLRPIPGDLLVRAVGLSDTAAPLRPDDIALEAPPLLAWPKDPASSTVRDGSRLNQVLLLRLDPASLTDETVSHAVDGVLAYSATCTHAQCPVTEWRQSVGILHCPCHGSEFDPRAGGQVVNGPRCAACRRCRCGCRLRAAWRWPSPCRQGWRGRWPRQRDKSLHGRRGQFQNGEKR